MEPAAKRPVCERPVSHHLQPEPWNQARHQAGMTQCQEEGRQGPGRERAKRVAVGQNRGADPAGVSAEQHLADRTSGVVAHDGHVAQAERLNKVQHELGDPTWLEVGARVHGVLVSAERKSRRVAADALSSEMLGHGVPEAGVDQNPVREDNGRAGA